jgi:hypothetical protein
MAYPQPTPLTSNPGFAEAKELDEALLGMSRRE